MHAKVLSALWLATAVIVAPGVTAAPIASAKVAALPFMVPERTDPALGYRFWLALMDRLEGLPDVEVSRDGAIGRVLWTVATAPPARLTANLSTALRGADTGWIVTGVLRTDEQGRMRCTGLALRVGDAKHRATPDYIIENETELPVAATRMAARLAGLVTGGDVPDAQPTVLADSESFGAAARALDAAVSAKRTSDADVASASVDDLGRAVCALLAAPSQQLTRSALEEMLRSALVARPGHVGAIVLLGCLHLSRGAQSDALAALRWAAELAPDNADVVGLAAAAADPVADPTALRTWALNVAQSLCGRPTGVPSEQSPPEIRLAAPEDSRCVVRYEFVASGDAVVRPAAARAIPEGELDLGLPSGESVSWPEGGGLAIIGQGVAVATGGPAAALTRALQASGELTVEVLLTPESVEQRGPARIVSLSVDTARRNFTLGQEGEQYVLRLRTTETDEQGMPEVRTPAGTLRAERQHVAVTYGNGAARLYVNGVCVTTEDRAGGFANWDPRYRLIIGNEDTLDRQWHGAIEQLAVYDRALRPDEIAERCRRTMKGNDS